MLRNYFTTTLRNLQKNTVFTFINLMGLSMGMATFILIFQYISFEQSVNGFHANLPNLHRVLMQSKNGEVWDGIAPGLMPISKQQLTEIKDFCRIAEGSSLGNGVVTLGASSSTEKLFREKNFAYADGNFFELFTFHITEGVASSLKQPNTVALSHSTAKKYFGEKNAVGNVLILNNQFGKTFYTITTVFDDMPQNSDFQYDLIFSIETLANKANLNGNEAWASLDGLGSQWMKAYLFVQPAVNLNLLETKITEVKKKANPEGTEMIRLQPMAQQHLASSLNENFPTTGSLGLIYLLSGISIFILAIAWFNYINLSTASSLKRAKEVGIRKVAGASKQQLIWQFLGESLLMNLLAFIIALAVVNVLQGSYNYFIQKELSFKVLEQNNFWVIGLGFIIIGSLASGGYTAFALSSFSPSKTLKGIYGKSSSGIWMRKTLVVFQFTTSIVLIASTLILQRQLHYVQNENLGMEIGQLFVINGAEVGKDETFKSRSTGFENELAQHGFIESFCRTGGVPVEGYNYATPGITKQNPLPGDEKLVYSILEIDFRFLDTYSIKLAAGQEFTEELGNRPYGERDKIMVNEKAANQLGFATSEEAVGQKVIMESKAYEVIGVVKDYHHLSLHQAIDPIIFFPRNSGGFYTLKLSTENIQAHVASLNKLFKKYFPGNPFVYSFLDDNYNLQYKTEQQYGTLFSIASCLAIFIACLGLFGLAMFTVEQRTKEIGIRKVLGASITKITTLLSKDFLVLVTIAIIIATPLSWYAMHKWLQDFAYRIEISWWIFGIAGGIAVSIALITVSSQAIRAALSNPVESLKNE